MKITSKQVCTLHSIAGSINYKYSNGDTKFQSLAIFLAARSIKANPLTLMQISKLKNVKWIFVDEAQDLAFD